MKKLLLLCLFFLPFLSFAQLPNAELEIGAPPSCTSCNSLGNAIIQTSDSGYAICGYSDDYGYSSSGNVYIIKLNKKGVLEWTKTVGGTSGEDGVSIIQAYDKGYAITGTTSSYGFGGDDPYIIKLDSNGILQWTKVVGGAVTDYGTSIVQTYDRGYAVAGITSSYGAGGDDVYVIKLDSNGNLKWTKTIGGTGDDEGNSIIQTSDSGLVIAGATNSFGAGSFDVYVVKLDSAGNLKWTKTIGGPDDDEGYSIVQTRDNGYAICGETISYGAGGYDVYFIKLDSAGNLKWTKTVGGTLDDKGYSIVNSNDGGFIATGYTSSYVIKTNTSCFPTTNVYIVKLDSSGNLQWTKTIGNSCQEGYSIVRTKDQGFTITGYDISSGIYVFFLKSDSNGKLCQYADTNGGLEYSGGITNSGGITGSGGMIGNGSKVDSGGEVILICNYTGVQEIKQFVDSISVYPNPNNGRFTIFCLSEQGEESPLLIEIYNVFGEKVLTKSLRPHRPDDNLIDLINQPNGIYLYRILKENGSVLEESKLIIQK